jgi:maltokinase
MNLPWADWLSRQRWYAGRNRSVHHINRVVTEIDADLDHVVLEVGYDDGGVEHYQAFVGWERSIPDEYLGVALIGEDGGRIAVDALYDDSACRQIIALIGENARRDGLAFVGEPHSELDLEAPVRVGDAEQSNTSVIIGQAAIFKLFRRLVAGINPDVELGRVLAHAGSPHVAKLLGSIEDVEPDGEPRSLAMLTEFAHNSMEGWAMALTSARDLLVVAEDPDTPEPHAEEMGGDFAAEAYRLGEAVASVHLTLAETLGVQIAPPPIERMRARMEAASAEVPELAPLMQEARAALDRVNAPTALQRVHGDLHLGQVLRTPDTWLLIDFEGEPGKPIAERRANDSALRDVAGMLRSFDYAAHYLLVDYADDETAMHRAQDWSHRNRDAFCDGYAAAGGGDPREQADLLRAYELDKALYEAAYEARHRPHWLWIPLRTLTRLLPTTSVKTDEYNHA